MRDSPIETQPLRASSQRPQWSTILRALREARGLTQDGWARLLGYSVPTVRRWERGAAVPTAEAEAAMVAISQARGLFRTYARGPLAGLALTPELLAELLAEARVASVRPPPAPRDPPRLVTLSSVPHSPHLPLPVPLTTLIGREHEVTAASDLLAGRTRLLTLTGPGGAGKTRLALAIAERAAADGTEAPAYPDGVGFVDLSPISDPSLVTSAIARGLGIQETEGQPLTISLVTYLRGRRLLLVLDNFEQVVDAAPLLHELLACSPGLALLVTSRALLHLQGEWEYAVAPLPFPDPIQVSNLAALAKVPAVELFVLRAEAAQTGFALTAENAAVVAAICARLDGLPLALELAAARLRILSPSALLARLEPSLPLLTGGARDLPTRQQTLRNTIAWSYDLLSPTEQLVFRRLGVFAGGCTIPAARATLDATKLPGGASSSAQPSDMELLDVLGALVEQSLLRKEDGPEGEPRFLLLATVREFAQEQLVVAGEVDAVHATHAAFFLNMAEEAAAAFFQLSGVAWLDRLEREHDNLRSALDCLLQTGDGARSIQLAGALLWFWWSHTHLREGRDWLTRALALGGGAGPLRARALEAAGLLHASTGDHATGVRLLEEAVTLRRQGDDERGLTTSLTWLGNVLFWSDPDRSAAVHGEALALRRASGDQRGIFVSLVGLAVTQLARDDVEQAARLLEEAVSATPSVGDGYGLAFGQVYLAWTAMVQGDYDRAAAALRAGLPSAQADRRVSHVFLTAAVLAHEGGRPHDAIQLIGTADSVAERAGSAMLPGTTYATVRSERLRELRASVDEETFAAAWAEGQALSFDGAFSLVRAILDHTQEIRSPL